MPPGRVVTHVLARVAVWILVLGIAYLVLGPQVFDSSTADNPFHSNAPLYLPPEKSPRLRELEARLAAGGLTGDAAGEYRALARDWQADFWNGRDLTVEQALGDATAHRRERLLTVLAGRGLSADEAAAFFTVVQRDRPGLLDDGL